MASTDPKRKTATPEKCQSILWNLIEEFEEAFVNSAPGGKMSAAIVIGELFETERCDAILPPPRNPTKSLKNVRAEYSQFLGPETVQAVKTLQSLTPNMAIHCDRALSHYRAWTCDCLVAHLSVQNMMKYHTLYRFERVLNRFFHQ